MSARLWSSGSVRAQIASSTLGRIDEVQMTSSSLYVYFAIYQRSRSIYQFSCPYFNRHVGLALLIKCLSGDILLSCGAPDYNIHPYIELKISYFYIFHILHLTFIQYLAISSNIF